MTRQEYLEAELEELTDKCAADARALKSLTRNVDKRYTSLTRDALVKVALSLHDNTVKLDAVKKDLRQRAKVEEQRLELLGCE